MVDAYAKQLDILPTGELFNVCAGNASTLCEAIEILERIAGYTMEVKAIPLEETLRWMYEA